MNGTLFQNQDDPTRKPASGLLPSSPVRGATLVEIAIALPLMLSLIFFVLWYGWVVHGHVSFTTGVEQSLRLAVTRGDSTLVGPDILAKVSQYKISGNFGLIADSLASQIKPDIAKEYYNKCFLGDVFPNANDTLDTMPESYIYFLVYLGEYLKSSFGGAIKFPCWADDQERPPGKGPDCANGLTSHWDGAGCVTCRIRDPYTNELKESAQTSGAIPPNDIISVQCTLQPASLLAGPMIAMLRLVSPAAASMILWKEEFSIRTSTIK